MVTVDSLPKVNSTEIKRAKLIAILTVRLNKADSRHNFELSNEINAWIQYIHFYAKDSDILRIWCEYCEEQSKIQAKLKANVIAAEMEAVRTARQNSAGVQSDAGEVSSQANQLPLFSM